MELHAEEPEVGRWRAVDDDALVRLLRRWYPVNRPGLALVDGRSGAGKSTFATRAAALLGASMVSTDDVAWHLSMFGWTDALLAGVLEPWMSGNAVHYRPPGWEAHARAGFILVESGVPLVIEGVGAARHELARFADLVVWVQSDRSLARSRGLARDASYGTRTPAEAETFWDQWMTAEEPFLAADRPWERAHLMVLGTPPDRRTCVSDGPMSDH